MSKLTGVSLGEAPAPEIATIILERLESWFYQELGISIKENVSEVRVVDDDQLHPKSNLKHSYCVYMYDVNLEILVHLRPVVETFKDEKLGKRGGRKLVTKHVVPDWILQVSASTRNPGELTPANLASRNLTLLKHIDNLDLKGFKFDLTQTKDESGTQIFYNINKTFEATLSSLFPLNEDRIRPGDIIWVFASQAGFIQIDDLVDISPEVTEFLGGRFMTQYWTGSTDYGQAHELEDLQLTTISRRLWTWRENLSVSCPYAQSRYMLGGYVDSGDVILFWNNRIVANRQLCAGCAEEYKCLARRFEGGGYKLQYHLGQLEPNQLAS